MQQDNPLVVCCLWLSRLAWLNLCWWLMTLAGLVVSGVVPASVVTLQMMRRYLQGKQRVYFSECFVEWKNEWRRSNATLLPLLMIALALFQLFTQVSEIQNSGWLIVLGLSALPLALVISLLAMAVLLELSVWSCSVKQGWINGILLLQHHFALVILTAFSAGVMGGLCLLKPICGVFFLFSPVALISMLGMMKIRPQLFEEHK